MAKVVKKNYYRLTLQWLVLIGIVYLLVRPWVDKAYTADFEAYCPFGGLQALSSFLANNSLACSMTTTQIAMGLALILGIFVFSKLFCSYLCPIGTFTEWLGWQGKRFKMNFVITGIADRLLRIFKYAILFITFYFSISSSELFCKKFDPYYALFSGFGSDVVMGYAVMALLLAIPGSFFIRQFWCKYFCPLSAASNIFSFAFVFLGIAAVYAALTLGFGLSINWIWLLGALSLAGVILETTRMKFGFFPIIKITREASTCTSCKLCDKVCPMAIKISDKPVVDHIDCHLCVDCVTRCPEPDTLKLNRRGLYWLPAVATVALVALGLAFASITDIPTISLKWGTSEQMNEAGIYQQSGLKSVKCYGSAMSFANHMKELPGVLGVEAFVSDFSVKVYFDKSVTDETKIRESIFTPVTRIIAAPSSAIAEVSVSEFAVDQFFDPSDARMLSIRSSQHPGILAFETLFGEPVHTLIYYDAQLISEAEISQIIEAKKVEWESDGDRFEAKTNFKVASVISHEKIAQSQYLAKMYENVEMNFNGFEEYTFAQLDSLDLDFPGAADPAILDMPWYLLSHVSNDKGVVRFQTVCTNSGIKLRLVYVPALTNRDRIIALLNQPELDIHMSDGTKQVMKNPYKF